MILIIGAGLSGLLIGYHLKKQDIPFKILEARDRVGGRINTIYGPNYPPIEMGATWFTHQHKQLLSLLNELEIEYFEQFMDRTVFFQAGSTSKTQTIEIPPQAPSFRISGGTAHLINTLVKKLDKNDILLNQTVKHLKFKDNSVQVIAEEVIEGTAVVLAIPPKLWANRITFKPELPINLSEIAKQTHTWMEDSIKVALSYTTPFWQENNKPGTLFSQSGPITEFYDHCNHKRSKYALCGFMNSALKTLTASQRKSIVIEQITAVFGLKAKDFITYEECVWSNDVNTFEPSEVYPHQNNGNPIFRDAFFDGKVFISSSEAASEFPGYMEGAIRSANAIAKKIKER
ncbi:FAD-dependent oxidoreductase [Bizionia gelidisalsuginis]|uniref:FAD-dependent oxidoreductase n=1 Tax=Bizionia gelidisalsuginis TaxID=291188 RepID=A0ABY3MDD4_9FLAO|nr:FAD-dependent oxidoreductase [Bizionia gelidisalsuginis]TYC16981.1 FAD-dependent oxidoreductase [Bizionia gelidisalsuginis]